MSDVERLLDLAQEYRDAKEVPMWGLTEDPRRTPSDIAEEYGALLRTVLASPQPE